MNATSQHLRELTTAAFTTRNVVTVPKSMSLRDAARHLDRAGVTAAPVVDEQGVCVGLLSASDFLPWIEQGCPDAADSSPCCPYQVRGRLPSGESAVICTRAEGTCLLQVIRPTANGQHTPVCTHPCDIISDWQVSGGSAGGAVARFMKSGLVLVSSETPLPELARIMADTHAQTVVVLDDRGRPVGVVSGTDILVALVP